MDNSEWVTMREAADRLGISYFKLTRLAAQNELQTRETRLDKRVKLVNLEEVKQLFGIK